MADRLPPTRQNVKFISREGREAGEGADNKYLSFASFASFARQFFDRHFCGGFRLRSQRQNGRLSA
jgi:hypothetical protein